MGNEVVESQQPEAVRSPRRNDVVVIRRSWLIVGLLMLVSFIIGAFVGFQLALTAYSLSNEQPTILTVEAPEADQGRFEVSSDDDPAIGPADAPVTIVEFSDFRCAYCKRWHEEVFTALLAQYGDQLRFVYRDYPVVGGQTAAEASECADEQGVYWDYHSALFSDPAAYSSVDDYVTLAEDMLLDEQDFRSCLESGRYSTEVNQDMTEARFYGVSGTPTFFINGIMLVGAQPLAQFQAIIDQELSQLGG